MSERPRAIREAEVVVLGAGVAGLSVALGLAGRGLDLLAKGPLANTGNSPLAQGGVAAAVGPGDTPEHHATDTLAVGGAIGDPEAVARLTSEGPARLADLIQRGARFDRSADGALDLAREAAHSRHRILHSRDATGAEIVRALRDGVRETSGLAVFEHSVALDLVVDSGRVVGVLARHADGALVLHRAAAVVLATGGAGRVFARTTNPAEATADGLSLAWRSGARLGDLEFVQFHPTALDVGGDPMPLLTEALRGAGARLVDEGGRPIFDTPGGELQARDVVARGIWRALEEGRRPLLDAREAVGDTFPERFPTVFEACRERGLDPRSEAIPVAPAAHYHMGGVLVDLEGRTSQPGLWAAGEVACTGVHGANRLASNSLLEALVYGGRVARSVGESLSRGSQRAPLRDMASVGSPGESSADTSELEGRLRRLMWEKAGLVRTGDRLREALAGIDEIERQTPPGARELRSLVTAGRLIARAALARPESRGAHFRLDHAQPDAAWRGRLVLSRIGGHEHVGFEPASHPRATGEVVTA
ncbi:MAG: L-aspartate oxidase [Acidobacteriota bacterium]|jgi:L-aspartate oxidase